MSYFSNILNGVNSILQPLNDPNSFNGFDILNGVNTIFNGINAERQHQSDLDWSAAQADKNRAFQTSERVAAQEYNEEMWHKQNEYNSPENQLKLAMAAGINPNMAISGAVGNGFARNAPSSTPMSGNMAGFPNGFAGSMLQAEQLAANARKTQAEATGKEIENSYAPSLNNQVIRKAEKEIEALGKQNDMSDEELRQAKELFPLLYGKNEQELKTMEKQFEILVEDLSKAKSESTIADNEAAESNFKRKIRESLGADPDSSATQVFLQLVGSGPEGIDKAKSLLKFIITVGTQLLRDSYKATLTGKNPLGRFLDFLFTDGGTPTIINPYE